MSERARGRTCDRGRGRTGRGNGRGESSNPERALTPFPAIPATPVNVVNQFQCLGTIPTSMPYSSALASQPKPFDPLDGPIKLSKPFDICPQALAILIRNFPIQKSTTDYVPTPDPDNLFFVEPNMTNKKDPVKLAEQFFPPG